jgi:branched-chain amino acid transport system permease protein
MAELKREPLQRPDQDHEVRGMWDRITRDYLRSVISPDLIAEHRRSPTGHHSEPLARLLAWCQRRPLSEQYAVKAEADGTFRIVSMTGRRGVPPTYIGDARFASLEDARHGVLLQHISDLTGK